MPKVKQHSRAKKTFKLRSGGTISFQKAGRKHLLGKKSKQRKRRLRESAALHPSNKEFVLRLLRLR